MSSLTSLGFGLWMLLCSMASTWILQLPSLVSALNYIPIISLLSVISYILGILLTPIPVYDDIAYRRLKKEQHWSAGIVICCWWIYRLNCTLNIFISYSVISLVTAHPCLPDYSLIYDYTDLTHYYILKYSIGYGNSFLICDLCSLDFILISNRPLIWSIHVCSYLCWLGYCLLINYSLIFPCF